MLSGQEEDISYNILAEFSGCTVVANRDKVFRLNSYCFFLNLSCSFGKVFLNLTPVQISSFFKVEKKITVLVRGVNDKFSNFLQNICAISKPHFRMLYLDNGKRWVILARKKCLYKTSLCNVLVHVYCKIKSRKLVQNYRNVMCVF